MNKQQDKWWSNYNGPVSFKEIDGTTTYGHCLGVDPYSMTLEGRAVVDNFMEIGLASGSTKIIHPSHVRPAEEPIPWAMDILPDSPDLWEEQHD